GARPREGDLRFAKHLGEGGLGCLGRRVTALPFADVEEPAEPLAVEHLGGDEHVVVGHRGFNFERDLRGRVEAGNGGHASRSSATIRTASDTTASRYVPAPRGASNFSRASGLARMNALTSAGSSLIARANFTAASRSFSAVPFGRRRAAGSSA